MALSIPGAEMNNEGSVSLKLLLWGKAKAKNAPR